MITLQATYTLQGKAGTGSAITYTISGDSVSAGVDTFQILGQGQLGTSAGNLVTAVPASTIYLISDIHLANTTGSAVNNVILYVNGSAATNQLVSLSIPANGEAVYTNSGWTVYDSNSSIQTGSVLAGDVSGASSATVLATVNSNTGSFGSATQVGTFTVNAKGLTTAASNTPIQSASTSQPGFQSAVDKLKEDNMWYDIVAQGGADRTGAVDATAIIQTAIDTVSTAGGGIVFIPRGTYKVTAAITITGNFVTVRGASRVASKLVPTQATGNVFTVSGIFNRFEYLRIEPATNNLRTAGYAIEFTSTASNCGCQWVDILFQWSAVKATGQLCRLEDMNIRECGYGAANGCMILIDSFTDQYLSKIVCDNAPASVQATFAGIRITNLSSLLMSDCQIIHCQVGMDVAPASTNTIPSIYCMNTFFDTGTIGAKFTSGSGNIFRCRFLGVWFSSNTTAGVVINGTTVNGLDFIGCEFYGNPLGIDAQAAAEWGVRASRFAGNTTNAIKTTAGSTHSFSITDNVIGNVSGFGANAQGINIQAGTYKRYQILDNRGLESNTALGIIDLGVVAATDQKSVSNNMGTILKGAVSSLSGTVAVPVTTETLVLNARIPANGVSVGQVFRIKAVAILAGANVCTWRVRTGALGTVAGDTVVANIVLQSAAGFLNGRSAYEGYFTVRSLGAPGSGEGEGIVVYNTAANASSVASTTAAAATTTAMTTTADWFIDVSLSQTIAAATAVQAVIEAL